MSEHANDPEGGSRPPLAAFAVAALGLALTAAALTAYSAEGLAGAVRLASVRYSLGLAALAGAAVTVGAVAFLALGPLRRQREEQAERAQWRARCEDLLHAFPDGVCLIDADFIVREPVSPSLSAALRCKLWPGMDLVETLRPLLAAETVEALRAYLRQCFAARAGASAPGRNPLQEATFPGPPSRPSQWGFRFEPVRHGERVAYLLVIATDIGERQRIARELAGARMRLRAQIDGLLRACLRDGLQIRSCLGHADAALERARVRLPRLCAAVGAAEREASLRSLLQEARTIKHEAAEIELELLETPAHHLELDLLDLLESAAAARAGDEGARLTGHLELLFERIAMVRDFVVGLDARAARKNAEERTGEAGGERADGGAADGGAAGGAALARPAPRTAAALPAPTASAAVAEPGPAAAFVARLRRPADEPGSQAVAHDARVAAATAASASAVATAVVAKADTTPATGRMPTTDAPALAMRASSAAPTTATPRPASAPAAGIAPAPVAERKIAAPVPVSVSPSPARLTDAAIAALVLSPQRSEAAQMHAHVSNRSGDRDASGPNDIGPEELPASPSPAMDALAAASTDAADPFALVPLLALSGDGEAALPADRAAFVDWAALARRLAGAQGKAVRVEAVLDPFPRLPPERAAMLRDVGMELVANAVLHGIEPMSARRRLGKDPVGAVRLTLGFDEREGWLFCVRDDGRGVDLARLRDALVRGGACTPAEAARLSEREAIVKVFEPGVTTAMQAEGARGHGLGLPNAVERLRGLQARVSLVTVPGRSTEVRIAWPPG
ncbi:ATP-binding protein [Lysobacter enzymogenes]|uniref:ATP-binding protein n=1 Tax=Lysobacter enzymogenes TaxID=69 RepID=UPI001AFC3E8A|nr:ATP-binding protein [Lysobacter enzymogenes]QQQ02563.1 hypothetical protein JHW41_06165 [Lysobacter enzymogenes]